MNIFFVHRDPAIAAQMLHDKHVVKMILETAQILSTAAIRHGAPADGLYKPTHENHPSVRWAGDVVGNFAWLSLHGTALCREYSRRFGKIHKSQEVVLSCIARGRVLPAGDMTDPPQCMPEEYKIPGDPVGGYRRYYLGAKVQQSRWTRRPVPRFVTEGIEMSKKKQATDQAAAHLAADAHAENATRGENDAHAEHSAVVHAAAEVAAAVRAPDAPRPKHNRRLAIIGAYTPESAITWNTTVNPRAKGKATHDRFAKYLGSNTVAEYTANGGTKGDLLWDLRSGYLSIAGVELSGEVQARAPKAPKAAKEPKAPKVKAEKVVKEASAEQLELEESIKEETID